MKKTVVSQSKLRLTKIVLVALLSLLLATCLLAVCACDKHEHSYVESTTKQPTCQEKGEKTFTCSCGDSYTEEIETVDHKYTSVASDAAQHWNVCEYCKATTDHVDHTFKYSSDTTQHWGICEYCKATTDHVDHNFKYVSDEAQHHLECVDCKFATASADHEHNIFVSKTDSTCLQKGEKVYKCECGHTTATELSLADHNYTAKKSNADFHWLECAVCGKADPNNAKEAHSWKVVEVTLQSTCTQTGNEKIACDCGYTKTRQTSALGHDFTTLVLGESNSNGHRLKCNRCDNFIFVNHNSMSAEFIGENRDCPDGYNREATCYQTGHQDKACKVCNNTFHTTSAMTGEHNFSQGWTTNGTNHWHVCLNGNGKCTAKSGESAHSFETVVDKQPTCAETGHQSNVCSVCSAVQSGSNKTLEKQPHDYETKETLQQATCFAPLKTKVVCKNCSYETERIGDKLEHDWSGYQAGANGKHYKECSLCHTKNEGNHDIRKKVIPAVNCGDEEITQYYCYVCNYVQSETKKVKQHQYVSSVDESKIACGVSYEVTYTCSVCSHSYTEQKNKEHSYSWNGVDYPATCVEYGYYFNVCSICGKKEKVVDEEAGYGNHVLKRVQERPATETEIGIAYSCYYCEVCEHYLADNQDKACRDFVDSQVVIPKIETVEVETIAQLKALADAYDGQTPSANFYLVSATVLEGADGVVVLVDVDENGDLTDTYEWYVELPQSVNYATINEEDRITLRGHLQKDDDDFLTDVEVLSVDDGSTDTCSLFITSNISNTGAVYVEYGSDYFYNNMSHYNCLLKGDTITFTFTRIYGDADNVLQSVIINNKSYVVTNGVLEDITVDGDIYAEFIYGNSNTSKAVVEKVETGEWNADPYAVNGYVTCEYDGATTEDGTLSKDSHTRFTVENAYITTIVIEFAPEDVDTVTGNKIFVGTDKDHKGDARPYTISNRNKATLTFDEADGLTYFEYAATSSKANVVSITIHYNTWNTLPQY